MDSIPPRLSPEETPPIHTLPEMHLHWRRIVGRPGFASRELWVTLLDPDHRVLPTLQVIEDLTRHPTRRFVRNLIGVYDDVLARSAPGGSIGMMLARPGGSTLTAADLRWSQALQCEATRRAVPLWPLFIAADDAVVPADPEDLAA